MTCPPIKFSRLSRIALRLAGVEHGPLANEGPDCWCGCWGCDARPCRCGVSYCDGCGCDPSDKAIIHAKEMA